MLPEHLGSVMRANSNSPCLRPSVSWIRRKLRGPCLFAMARRPSRVDRVEVMSGGADRQAGVFFRAHPAGREKGVHVHATLAGKQALEARGVDKPFGGLGNLGWWHSSANRSVPREVRIRQLRYDVAGSAAPASRKRR